MVGGNPVWGAEHLSHGPSLSHASLPPVQLIASVDYLRVSQEITTYEGNEAALRTGDIEFAVGIWLFSLGTAFLVYDMRATVLAICKLQGRPPPPWKEDKTLQVLVLYSASLVLFGIASTLYILPGDTSQTIGVALFVVSNVSVTSINLIGLWYLWKAHGEEWEVQWLHDATLAAVDAMEAAHHERSMHGGVAGHGGRETEEDPVELVEERRPPRNSSGTHPPPQRSSSATSELQHQQQPHRDDMAVPAAASERGSDDADDGPPSVRSSLGDDTSHSGTGRARYRVSLSMNRVSTPRASLAHIDETPVVSEGTRHALASAGLLPSARLSKARMSTRMARQQSFDRSSAGSPRAAGSSEGGTPPLSVRSSADLDVQQQRSSGDRLPPSSSLREFGVGRRLSQVQDSSGEDADAPVSSRTTDTV